MASIAPPGRIVVTSIATLLILSATTLAFGRADAQPRAAVAPAPTTTIAPTTTTTAAPIVVTTTTAPPAPPTTPPAPRATVPVTTRAPVLPVVRQLTGSQSCGWAWDATRIDDGSLDEVLISLNAPRRPNQTVVITAAPHGPTTLPTVRPATTDADGNAAVKVTLSEDKRDWTITVSAVFATGGMCAAQTFTITYD